MSVDGSKGSEKRCTLPMLAVAKQRWGDARKATFRRRSLDVGEPIRWGKGRGRLWLDASVTFRRQGETTHD